MHLTRVFVLVRVDRIVYEKRSNNFIEVIMITLVKGGGLMKEELSKKLLCFGTNVLNVF
jgi:hypothetical protein